MNRFTCHLRTLNCTFFCALCSLAFIPVFAAEDPNTPIPLTNETVKTIEFRQVNLLNDEGELVQADVPIGRVVISPQAIDAIVAERQGKSEIEKVTGYVNVVIDGKWIARNIPITRQTKVGSLAFKFDLGGIAGQDVTTISAAITFSATLLLEAPDTPEIEFQVSGFRTTLESLNEIPLLSDQMFPVPEETKDISQDGFSFIESAVNQGLVSSFANAIAYLENNSNLEQTLEHSEGIAGDATLVGQLDQQIGRNVSSRQQGDPVDARDGLEGLLRYLIGQQNIDKIRSSVRGVLGGSDIETELDGVIGITRGRGSEISYNNIYYAMKRGSACIAGVGEGDETRWSNILAAGLNAGEPWMVHYQDRDESSDLHGGGQEGISFTYLKSNSSTGRFTLYESGLELNHLFCLEYKREFTRVGSLIPSASDTYTVEDLRPDIIVTIDEAGHICCVEIVPLSLKFTFENGMLKVDGAAPWLPFTGVLNADGSFNASSISTVAGFQNILSTISGLFDKTGFNADISLGVNGGLNNSGVPITWQVRVEPKYIWPWLEKEYEPRILKPSILANNLGRRAILRPGNPLELALKMEAGDRTDPADWWLAAETDDFTGFYDLDLGTFQEVLKPVFQGPLSSIGYTTILRSLQGLPLGDYKIHFYVDTEMNGQIDFDSLVGETFELEYREPDCSDVVC